MPRPRLEVADVIRAHGQAFLDAWGNRISSAKKRVLYLLVACRTAVLGGHVNRCDSCSDEQVSYNSCRNRHCPKCQAAARAAWLEAREAELLPVPYFHVVFTVPQEIAAIALQNKKVVYGLLFETSARTLKQIAADPKHLGAEIGFLSVLHTWGQTLQHHPHIHCVVPGGGIAPDGTEWIDRPRQKRCRRRCSFFLPVKVLSALFRGKLLARLKAVHAAGELTFQGKLAGLADPAAFARHLAPAYLTDWVVYAKAPFGGPKQVLKYLACYTHRVAISNRRLVKMEHGKVTFSYKDYANGNQKKTMTLDAVEFIRRFLLHVLPSRFVRIRHYGFLANRARQTKLKLCRRLLGVPEPDANAPTVASEDEGASEDDDDGMICPSCGVGRMLRHRSLKPEPAPIFEPVTIDTS